MTVVLLPGMSTLTGHLDVDYLFRGWLAGGDVFTAVILSIAGIRHSIASRSPVKACVTKLILQPHVPRMAPGGRCQVGIITERRKPLGIPFNIDQINHLGFEIGINLTAKHQKAADVHMLGDKDASDQAEGHTDPIGSETYNQQLSERRAAAVKNVLIQRGIDPRRIRSIGFGESQPISSDNASNRRVTLRIIPLVDGGTA